MELYLQGGCSKGSATIFSQVTSDRTRGNILNLYKGRLRLDIRRNVLLKGLSSIETLPREMVESPSLEILRRHVYVALRDTAHL